MTGGNTPNLVFKGNAKTFSKKSTSQENNRISKLKRRLRSLYKKGNFKLEIRPMIENLKMSFIN